VRLLWPIRAVAVLRACWPAKTGRLSMAARASRNPLRYRQIISHLLNIGVLWIVAVVLLRQRPFCSAPSAQALVEQLWEFAKAGYLDSIKAGKVGLTGATGAVLDRSLIGMRGLIDRSLAHNAMNAAAPDRWGCSASNWITCEVIDRTVRTEGS
jgi:hypothetical protein